MPKKVISGKEVIRILCREFGFYFVSQRGSHAKLKRKNENREIVTIVPLHKELARGTLKGILELAEIDEEEFFTKI
jgi:predicted RNA binding protein YcfA (HicA-like mRNA interferase family)